LSLIFGFWKFLKCILNQNSYFWGGVCFMNFLIWGFLNDFINSSGIIFEFHYNFIIFFAFGFHDSIQKISIFFYPLYPPKNDYFGKIWPFWHFLVLFGFFLTTYTPPKKKKNTILAQFCHFGIFWHFWDFFLPPIPPKKPKKWLFWQNVAILALFSTFLGGVKIAQKKIMLFKYSPLATQNSKNFYTHCFLIISQIILTGPGLSYQRVLEISCIYCLGQNSKNLLFMIFQDWNLQKVMQ